MAFAKLPRIASRQMEYARSHTDLVHRHAELAQRHTELADRHTDLARGHADLAHSQADLAHKLLRLADDVRIIEQGMLKQAATTEAIPRLVEAVTSSQTAIRLLRRDRPTQQAAQQLAPPVTETWRAWIDPQIEVVCERLLRREAPATLNRTPRLADWSVGGRLGEWMTELRQPHAVHRKMWEYAMCLEGMERFGVVTPEAEALAVGAGSESPLFYYANKIRRMVATDLYDNPQHEGTPLMLSSPASFAPFPYREDRLEVMQMPGDDLRFADNTFDFAFCLSSIEHFGSRETQARALSEMARVVRPRGIVCVITELVLNGEQHPEYFRPSEIWDMFLQHPTLALEGPLDTRVSDALLPLATDIRVPADLAVTPHLLLTDGRVLWTSLCMFFRKT